MDIFASTTFLGPRRSDIQLALEMLSESKVNGVELGSTHYYSKSFKETVLNFPDTRFMVHNYCPPAKDSLVLNIASADPDIVRASIDHIKGCLDFSSDIGARLYTLHPGFTVDPAGPGNSLQNYDFIFSQSRHEPSSAMDRMSKSLDEIIVYARAAGVPVAIETEGSCRHPDKLLMQRPEEFESLKSRFGQDLGINLNIAHTLLASKSFGFSVSTFIQAFNSMIKAAELSHCNCTDDQHRPLVQGSYIFKYLPLLSRDTPLILELRNATIADINNSLNLLRASIS